MDIKTKRYDYGIITENVLIHDAIKGINQRTALLGQIVKVDAVLGNKCVVRFLKEFETWESSSFTCPHEVLQTVDEKLWEFLAAVASPQERVKLAKNKSRCEKLMRITTEVAVGFTGDDDIYLGTVKYIGMIKGIGKGFGIKLHEKKRDNMCEGTCANIQYFTCLPGYGLFTTIEKIEPQFIIPEETPPKTNKRAHIDSHMEKNVSRISISYDPKKQEELRKRDHENTVKNKPSSYFKSSHSLQNILDETTVNPNNDFDQNTILQPENVHLINKNVIKSSSKTKSDIDLIDAIGGVWSGTTDSKQLENFSNLKKDYDKFDSDLNSSDKTNGIKSKVRNMNSFSGSKTVPRKTKLAQERLSVKSQPTAKFYINNLELNEKSDPTNKKSIASTSHFEENLKIYYEPDPSETHDFTIGSLVEVINDVSIEPLYGVIKWMGIEEGTNSVLVGVELEEEQLHLPITLTDGTHNGQRFFECNGKRAFFVPLSQCHKDSRFQDGTPTPVHAITEKMFGQKDCPVIEGSVAPLIMKTEEDVDAVCGKFRGIQGHHNSCYLDATLFAMFTYTAVFDSLLYRPKGPNDIPHYEEVQRVLREEIVNPLRTNLFVRADRVMTLRKLLDQLSTVSGLTNEEKDPEEFLNSLLAQILKAEPFLKLNSGQDAYYYQLFVEKDDDLELPSVQQLFDQSFLTSNIKLKEVPSCLIIQMPRFGKSYKMYPRILPSQLLDVTDIIENSPRQCTVCGKLARWECRDCYGECGTGLESTAFCSPCLEMAHSNARRTSHTITKLCVPQDFSIMADHCPPPRLYMELFAVVCIETSHYVAFVKCGMGHEAPWCFFDSMADRKGERNGYNIPEMVACPDVSKWLSDDQTCKSLHENSPLDRHLPEHARRLLCDAYICMYQSSDVMMYR